MEPSFLHNYTDSTSFIRRKLKISIIYYYKTRNWLQYSKKEIFSSLDIYV
ncbi:hypothetical protein ACM6L3_19315 [Paenibacillus larvae]